MRTSKSTEEQEQLNVPVPRWIKQEIDRRSDVTGISIKRLVQSMLEKALKTK